MPGLPLRRFPRPARLPTQLATSGDIWDVPDYPPEPKPKITSQHGQASGSRRRESKSRTSQEPRRRWYSKGHRVTKSTPRTGPKTAMGRYTSTMTQLSIEKGTRTGNSACTVRTVSVSPANSSLGTGRYPQSHVYIQHTAHNKSKNIPKTPMLDVDPTFAKSRRRCNFEVLLPRWRPLAKSRQRCNFEVVLLRGRPAS